MKACAILKFVKISLEFMMALVHDSRVWKHTLIRAVIITRSGILLVRIDNSCLWEVIFRIDEGCSIRSEVRGEASLYLTLRETTVESESCCGLLSTFLIERRGRELCLIGRRIVPCSLHYDVEALLASLREL